LYVALFPKGTNTFAPSKVISLNQTGQFPLASNFKQAVLFEVLRQADTGKLKLKERFNVTRANQSLGWYPYDNSDVIELAKRMIQFSDNTATDMLFRRIGLGNLHPTAVALGLCRTRLILPTKTWWAAQAGFGGSEWPKYALARAARSFANAPFQTQLEMAERLDRNAQQVSVDQLNKALKPYWDGRNGGREGMAEIDRNLQNASTPLEWARFIHHVFLENKLSSANQQRFREIMGLGTGRYFLKVPFVSYGGKSGNTARLLTHSGLIQTRSGDRLIYVYMNDRSETLATREQTPLVFRFISDALRKLMRPSDLVPLKPPKPPTDSKQLENVSPKARSTR
jgi:hypothetical protein